MNKYSNMRGFTLIEVMLVVSIIALLAAIATVSFGTARARASDTARQEQTKQMSLALEAYRNDYGEYPPIPASSLGTLIESGTEAWTELWTEHGMDTYMASPPVSNDPLHPYGYYMYEDPAGDFELPIIYTYHPHSSDDDPDRCYPFGIPSGGHCPGGHQGGVGKLMTPIVSASEQCDLTTVYLDGTEFVLVRLVDGGEPQIFDPGQLTVGDSGSNWPCTGTEFCTCVGMDDVH